MKFVNKTTERIKVRAEGVPIIFVTVYPEGSSGKIATEISAESKHYIRAYNKAGLTEVKKGKVEKPKTKEEVLAAEEAEKLHKEPVAPKEEKKKTVKEKPKEKPKSIVEKTKDLIKGKR